MLLPKDCLIYINEYINCFDKLFLTNIFFYNLYKCKIIKFRKLLGCLKHSNIDNIDVIRTLKIFYNKDIKKIERNYLFRKDLETLHFRNVLSLQLALKYMDKNDIDRIDHYCCGGKGIVFHKLNKLI